MSVLTNCPNCGAPLGRPSKCEYCGSVVENNAAFLPIEYRVVRPGMRKVEIRAQVALDPFLSDDVQEKYVTEILRKDMTRKLAEGLMDAVKFTLRKDYNPCMASEVVLARGELWVADCDPRY